MLHNGASDTVPQAPWLRGDRGAITACGGRWYSRRWGFCRAVVPALWAGCCNRCVVVGVGVLVAVVQQQVGAALGA